MANIQKVTVSISLGNINTITANITGYLGIGGREFCLNIDGVDDFVSNQNRDFIFGVNSNVKNEGQNNPSKITDDDCDLFPPYIRLEFSSPGKAEVTSLSVVVVFQGADIPKTYDSALVPLDLGVTSGKTIYLKEN